MKGVFINLPDDSAGQLLYAPNTKKTYILLDATFDENITSLRSMPNFSYQGTLKITNSELVYSNSDILIQKTGGSLGTETSLPDKSGLSRPDVTRDTRQFTR